MSKSNGNGKLKKTPLAEKSTPTPGGIIRRGQRRPYRKATRMRIERRVEELVAYMQKNPLASRFAIYKRFCKRWDVHWLTIDKVYIIRARQRLREIVGFTKNEAREITLGVVMRVLNEKDPRVRLKAAKAFAEITNCMPPKRTEFSGPEGGPIEIAASARPLVSVSTERLKQLANMNIKQKEDE